MFSKGKTHLIANFYRTHLEILGVILNMEKKTTVESGRYDIHAPGTHFCFASEEHDMKKGTEQLV